MSDQRVYHRLIGRAKEMAQDDKEMNGMLKKVGKKLSKVGDGSDESKGFLSKIRLLVRMVRAHISGRYRAFSPMTLVMFLFALVYFVTPIDIIPDFIPILGFTDDVTVALMIMKKFSGDIEDYRQWELEELSE